MEIHSIDQKGASNQNFVKLLITPISVGNEVIGDDSKDLVMFQVL